MKKLFYCLAGAALLAVGYFKFGDTLFNREHFSNYQIDEPFVVNFTYPDLALEEFSDREKADQAKDWLLFSLLTNGGLERKEIAEASFDLAPVRYGFNATLGNFEYGDTRSKFIGNGEVLALIPVSDEKTRKDNIAHILDEARKNQSEKPQKAFVFEYDLNTEGKFARVTRRENVDAASFFTADMGYFEMAVASLNDLKYFMDKTDDVTYAKKDDNGNLILGGRKIFGHTYGKATPEDVAAIWQSEKDIQEKQAGREGQINNLDREYQAEQNRIFDQYDLKIQALVFSDGERFSSLSVITQNCLVDYISSLVNNTPRDGTCISSYTNDRKLADLVVNMKAEITALEEVYVGKAQAMVESLEGETASASGFSLDPGVDFEKSIEFVKRYLPVFEKALWPEFSAEQLIAKLEQKQGDLMQYAIAKIDELFGAGFEIKKTCLYQKARYDGFLQGTEVGMTLFYTDLLAKIWSGNRFNSKPIEFIIGFKDHEQSYLSSPTVFEQESEALSALRLWFGPNKNGFQNDNDKTELTFARNATQIFALSNDPGSLEGITPDGVSKNIETQASAKLDVAISWWNNHYEEVGQYEKQFERLNEIMKWSTIISWLNAENAGQSLSFLANYPVNRNLWFPDWAKSNHDLKFKEWEKVSFFPRGYLGNNTEAIPILFSPNKIMAGGVSLAEKKLLKDAPGLLSAENNLIRRANIKMSYEEGGNVFTTFKATRVKFIDDVEANASRIELQPKEGYKLRNRYGEVTNTKFEWTHVEKPDGTFALGSKLGDTPIGELRAVATGKNGFSVGFEANAVDKGMAIAKQISDFKGDPAVFLRQHPEVVQYFKTEGGQWCAQVKNSNEWMVMRLDAKPATNIPQGWQARTSGSSPTSKIVEVKWVSKAEAQLMAKKDLPNMQKANPLDEPKEALYQRLVDRKGKDGAIAELALIEEKGVAQAKAFADKGEFGKAATQMDRIIQHFGETPVYATMRVRYQLKAGLKAIENGDLNVTARYFNEAVTHKNWSGRSNDFLDEANRMIDNANIPAEMKAEMKVMTDMYFTDRQMIVMGSWEGYKPFARQVPIEALSKKGAKVIYSEGAAFSKIDPTAPFEASIGQIRAIPGVQVYDISAQTIGRNTRFYATAEPRVSAAFFDIPTPNLRFKVQPGSGTSNCKDEDEDGNCDVIYTVPGPVYYVTTPSAN